MITKRLILLACFIYSPALATTDHYVMPPTSSTIGHVPVISDEQMEECVEIYNQARWLGDKLDNTFVNSYNQQEVDNYNQMVDEHTRLTNHFNAECAGKQSLSACKAAQKLNEEQGLPYQDCSSLRE